MDEQHRHFEKVYQRKNWDLLAQLCLLCVFSFYCFFLPAMFFVEGSSSIDPSEIRSYFVVSPLVGYLVGVLIRPLGGLYGGLKGDQGYLNRTLRQSSIALGLSTAVMGVLPFEANFGGEGSGIFIVLRFIQGFTVAAIYSCAATLTMDFAPEDRRGYYTGVLQSATAAGYLVVLASLVVLRLIFPKDQFHDFGWRFGYVFAVILIFMALSWNPRVEPRIKDQPVQKKLKDLFLLLKADRQLRGATLFLVLPLLGLAGLISYHGTVYQMTFLQAQLRLDPVVVKFILAVASLLYLPVYGVWGWMGDRYGHGKVFITGIILSSIFLFPSFYCFDLLAQKLSLEHVGFNRYVMTTTVLMGIFSAMSILSMSNSVVFLYSVFPKEWRTTLFGFFYNLSFGVWATMTQMSGLYFQQNWNSSYGSILFTLFYALMTLMVVLTFGRPFIFQGGFFRAEEPDHPQDKP